MDFQEAVHLHRRDFICPICGKAYSRDNTLKQHLMYHENKRDVVCQICGFKTLNKVRILRSTMRQIVLFSCFLQPKLERHMKSHTGERNYACEICGKRFLYSYVSQFMPT